MKVILVLLFTLSQSFLNGFLFQTSNRLKHTYSVSLCLKPEGGAFSDAVILRSKLASLSRAALVMAPSIALLTPKLARAAAGDESFVDSLAMIITSKKILEPTDKYIEYQAYDNARTNVNYILNQLQLQKSVKILVQSSIDFCDDMDAIDAAQEAGNRVANTAIQLDSTIYTCIFIPSDDGTVPPSAEKYRKQAYGYLESLRSDFDILLKVATDDIIKKANAKSDADVKNLPKVLFKVVGEKPKPAGY
jgi:hypothetical protein